MERIGFYHTRRQFLLFALIFATNISKNAVESFQPLVADSLLVKQRGRKSIFSSTSSSSSRPSPVVSRPFIVAGMSSSSSLPLTSRQTKEEEVDTGASSSSTTTFQRRSKSLISSFVLDIARNNNNNNNDNDTDIGGSSDDDQHIWSLSLIDDDNDNGDYDNDDDAMLSSCAKSWKALHSTTTPSSAAKTKLTLKSRLMKGAGNTIEIEVDTSCWREEETEQSSLDDLVFVLSRVIGQYTASHSPSTNNNNNNNKRNIIISYDDSPNNRRKEEEMISDINLSTMEGISSLFNTDPSIEIVDMVDQRGTVLGMVPRSFIHSLNILHRGIGLTVSKDTNFSELYVHRRTDFKRIFPSLYDMFVGGVSLSGENPKLTAAREVEEELGLNNEMMAALSDPLFTCVVCTSYNRCVVTVFQYTIQDPSKETITWQEEEVSWGDFVPYNIVEAAADLSIQRLVTKKEWPGMLPPILSKWKGSKPPNEVYGEPNNEEWTNWDFVPDGLLVWAAWLNWRENEKAAP